MTPIRKVAGVLLTLAAVVVTLLAAAPAAAHHNVPAVQVGPPGDCGETTFVASWPLGQEHAVDNHLRPWLLVYDGQTIHAGHLGSNVTVGPFEADTLLLFRVFGGGESNYHVPAEGWQAGENWVKGPDGPGGYEDLTADDLAGSPVEVWEPWNTVQVEGCPPEPEPSQEATEDPATDELADTSGPTAALTLAGLGLLVLVVGAGVYLAVRRRGPVL